MDAQHLSEGNAEDVGYRHTEEQTDWDNWGMGEFSWNIVNFLKELQTGFMFNQFKFHLK